MANSRYVSGTGHAPFIVDTPKEPLDGLVTTLHSTIDVPSGDELADLAPVSVHPSNLETVSSYNWVYGPGKRLRIIVPGYPPCWVPPEFPAKLPGDVGFRFIHQNEYFSPGTPLRPLLRAVYTHRPDFNIKEFDFIMDRNSLIKFYRFIYGGGGPAMVGNSDPSTKTESPQTPPTNPRSNPSQQARNPYTSPTSPDSNPSQQTTNTHILPTTDSAGGGRGGGSPTGDVGSWRDRHPASAGGGLRGRSFYGNTRPEYHSDRGRGSNSDRGRGGGRYIRGVWSPNFRYEPPPPEDTRIDVDIMGEGSSAGRTSMLMSRWDTHSSEVVAAGEFKGWGYQFMSAFTKFGDAGEDAVMDGGEAQSHHRVISYDFGGYRFLVRYHADAAQESLGELRWWAEKNRKEQVALEKIAKAVGKNKERDPSNQSPPGKKADDWLEKEFAEGLSKLNLNSISATSAIEAHKSLSPLYPHSSIVGIKTSSERNRGVMMSRALPQAFFSQTPHLYVGYHQMGTFQQVEKLETAALLAEWEKENETTLKKLLVLLGRIRKVVEGIEGRRASIIFCQGKESEGVKVYKRRDGTGGPVPSDLVAKWD